MKTDYLISSVTGKKLYNDIKDMAIIDYHCHLSPKEIYEDKPFNNIGEMWLAGDHYKWRLMRAAGVPEEYITGSADYCDKFQKYAETICYAAGNPLYHWTQMELDMYFGIKTLLNGETAQSIWNEANKIIKEKRLSPRKLIEQSKVMYIATTDDIADSLYYHKQIAEDKSIAARVTPSFRTDNVLQIVKDGYTNYIKKLADVSSTEITDLKSLKKAIVQRLDYFVSLGCKFTDVGIPVFPQSIGSEDDADKIFRKSLSTQIISDKEYDAFLGHMYVFLGYEYSKRNLVMQWHLAVKRNANTKLFNAIGADCGGDCMGDNIPVDSITNMLDAINSESGLPKTILYSLNPSLNPLLSTIAGSFRDVLCGAAWWFCDHKRGIEEQFNIIAETGYLGSFLGMLTDSRSFLSYARHDYFRRILCNHIGSWVDSGEYGDYQTALTLVRKISLDNIMEVVK